MNSIELECIEMETGPNPTHAVIWLHGLGADGNDFAPIVPELPLEGAPNIRFIFPHAPVQPVTINMGMSMRAWYDIYTPDLVRREDDAGIRKSESAIKALVARENVRGIDTDKIILAGFSQGCAMTLHTGLRLDEKLAGMVCLSGYLPLMDSIHDQRHSANQETDIFMAHGTVDPVVDISRGQKTHEILTELGYKVDWHEYPMPHSVHPQEVVDIGNFIIKCFSN